MENKHQNGYDNYIVIGGRRRWFETPIPSEHSPIKHADHQTKAASAKRDT